MGEIMLLQFSVENFQCLKNKTTLNMLAANLAEYKDSLIDNNVLPIASIYGPNGGGKTTLLKAFYTMQSLIAKPFNYLGGIQLNEHQTVIGMPIIPFKFDSATLNKPTNFEIFLKLNSIEYKYSISTFQNKIVSESLYAKNLHVKNARIKLIFNRENNNVELSLELKKNIKINNISDGMPCLVWIGLLYDVKPIKEIINWFLNTFSVDYNIPLQDEILLGNIYQIDSIDNQKNVNLKNKLVYTLKNMDLNIVNYKVHKKEIFPNRFKYNIITTHKVNDNDYNLTLNEESNGTKKIFALLPLFLVALEEARTIIVDELDAKLHPMLLKYIIELFNNKNTNPKGAQLIFTSHDLTTMTKELFRRDEIWFMALNNNEYSKLYSLVEIRNEEGNMVRPDASYNKQYLEGRYGADPYLQKILSWES